MTGEEVWKARINEQLAEADVRFLQIVYFFIIGLIKREGRIGNYRRSENKNKTGVRLSFRLFCRRIQ